MVMSNPRSEMPEDAKFVPVEDALEHGYHGITPDTDDNHIHTVAGVTAEEAPSEDKADSKKAASKSAAKEADK